MALWIFLLVFLLVSIDNPSFGSVLHYNEFFKDQRLFRMKEMIDRTPNHKAEYDFIVIGAGSAGSTLAARLSENENVTVLLIEAGGHEDLVMDVPVFALHLQFNRFSNWGFLTEPSKDYCLGMKNNQCNLPVGKVMGGSSTVNFMMATRGNKNDYNEWAQLTGDASWSHFNMMKYFKKLENYHNNLTAFDEDMHNFDGPVTISNVAYHTPLAEAFTEAGKEWNLPPVDYDGRKQSGFSFVQTNQINGERVSSNRAYLHPIRDRANLHLCMYSRVVKILIDASSKTAYGVRFVKTETDRSIARDVYAKREIFISAGSLNTPKLMMLSGIGPKKHLKDLGIEVLQDLPGVGQNLMDHIGYGGLTFLVNDSVSLNVTSLYYPFHQYIKNYAFNRKGPYTVLAGMEGVGFMNVDQPNDPHDIPNMELMMGGTHLASDPLLHVPFRLKEVHWRNYFEPNLYKHGYMIWPLITRPKSRGQLLLKDSDPLSHPRIIPNYLSHPEDVRIGIKGIRAAIKMTKTKAMQKYDARLYKKVVPGCGKHKYDSDDYWECALRTFPMTIWHFSGTCKMGRDSDKLAVVNRKLKVRGIDRLRIVDASIMPNIPTGHLNVPTMAIAEKISDDIKIFWGL